MKLCRSQIRDDLLKRRKSAVILEVVDDGCGFDTKALGNGGMGLRGMAGEAFHGGW